MEASSTLFTLAIILFIIEIVIMLAFIAPVLVMVFQILQRFNRLFGKVEKLEEAVEDRVGLMIKSFQNLPSVMKKAEGAVSHLTRKKTKNVEE